MGAKPGNKNAAKKGPGRVDVHASLADTRRAKVEKHLKDQGFDQVTDEMIIQQARQWLYDWIDGLPL